MDTARIFVDLGFKRIIDLFSFSGKKEERQLLVEKFALKDFNLIGFFTVELLSCSCFEEAKAAKVFKWKGMYFELLHDVLNI